MVTSQYVSTAERTNDNHVSRVLLGPCSVQLRDILRHHVPLSTFPQVIQRQSFKLPRLTQPQMDLILPRAGHYSGNYDDFDISLLYILLRNISNIPHTKGWGKDPVLSDVSLNVNSARIRIARNIAVEHIISSSMSNSDFYDIWSTVRTSVVAADTSLENNHQYEKAVDVLKHERMDSGMTKQRKTKHRGHMKETRKRIDETNKNSIDEESDINRLKQRLIKVNNDSTKVISLSPLHEREKELPIELLFAQVVIRNDLKYTEDGKNSDSMFEIDTSNQLPVRYHNQVWQTLFRSDSDSGSNVRRPSWGQLSVINRIKIKTDMPRKRKQKRVSMTSKYDN